MLRSFNELKRYFYILIITAADLGEGDAPPQNFEKKGKNTLDLIGFQLKKKHTSSFSFFITFVPLKNSGSATG